MTHHNSYPSIALALAASVAAFGCSRITTRVDVFTGELPAQGTLATERYLAAKNGLSSLSVHVDAVTDARSRACAKLDSTISELNAQNQKTLEAINSKTGDLEKFALALDKCIKSPKSGSEDCTSANPNTLDLLGIPSAIVLHRIRESLQKSSDDNVATAVLRFARALPGSDASLKSASSKIPTNTQIKVIDWHFTRTTFDTEIEPVLQRVAEDCKRAATALTSHELSLDTLTKSLDTACKDKDKDNPTTPACMSATNAVLGSLRLRQVELARTTSNTSSTLKEIDGISGSLNLTQSTEDTLSALRQFDDATTELHRIASTATLEKFQPHDANIREITKKENMDLWNKVAVDSLKVNSSGNSRYVIVQDGPVNFRLKELNSDPTSVARFGLTVADVGLEILNALVLKGALDLDKEGGSSGASAPPPPDATRSAELARVLSGELEDASADFQRELDAIDKSLAGKPTAAELTSLKARLQGLLERHKTVLTIVSQRAAEHIDTARPGGDEASESKDNSKDQETAHDNDSN